MQARTSARTRLGSRNLAYEETGKHGQQTAGVVKKQTAPAPERDTVGEIPRCGGGQLAHLPKPHRQANEDETCRAGSRLLAGSERSQQSGKAVLEFLQAFCNLPVCITHHQSRTQASALSPQLFISRGRGRNTRQGFTDQILEKGSTRTQFSRCFRSSLPSSHFAYPAPGPFSAFGKGRRKTHVRRWRKFWFLWVKSAVCDRRVTAHSAVLVMMVSVRMVNDGLILT